MNKFLLFAAVMVSAAPAWSTSLKVGANTFAGTVVIEKNASNEAQTRAYMGTEAWCVGQAKKFVLKGDAGAIAYYGRLSSGLYLCYSDAISPTADGLELNNLGDCLDAQPEVVRKHACSAN